MANIEQLHQLPPVENSWTPLTGDLVIIEPTNISPHPEIGNTLMPMSSSKVIHFKDGN